MKSFRYFILGGVLVLTTQNASAQFTKVTDGPLVTDSGQKLTTAWADFDGDGKVDGFVPNVGGFSFLYHNLGNGNFESLVNVPVAKTVGNSTAASWGDYDDDGNLDLFVVNRWQDHYLYRGLGGTNFEAVTNSSVLAGGPEAYSCSWVDYDNDGRLDLFVENVFAPSFLYHNNGDGTFTKNTNAAIANVSFNRNAMAWGDYNGDGKMDLFVANTLYRNDGNGVFTLLNNTPSSVGNGVAQSAIWVDYDNDGDLDLFVPYRQGPNVLYRNDGASGLTRITTGAIVTDIADSNGSAWGDFDNDGWIDLYVANGDGTNASNFLYHNNGDGTFSKITIGDPVTDTDPSASPVWVDYDNDGYVDLFVANTSGGNKLYHNNGGTNKWAELKLVGTVSNRAAIGAKVRVTAQINGVSVTQLREVSGDSGFTGQNLDLHFGLGGADIIDKIRVEWPSGGTTVLTSVTANQKLIIQESASSLTHVVPDGLQGNDGNYYSGIFRVPQRLQVVYDAVNFPSGEMTITELRFRRDINEPSFSNAIASMTVKLSTTTRDSSSLSGTYAENVGSDETTVFDGQWTFSSPSAANGQAKPFEIVLPLTTPFTYNPANGNLLFDLRSTSVSGASWTDGVTGTGGHSSRVLSLNPDATTGAAGELTGDVIQLVYNGSTSLGFSPNGGTFTNSVKVTIQSPIGSGTVRYTTDGSDPTVASQAYSGAFTLTSTTTVKARLYVNGYPASDVVEATYTLYIPPDIQFSPPGQLFTNQLSVRLINNVGVGVIRYTLDGSDPTTNSFPYKFGFELTSAVTIKARIFLNAYPISLIFGESYARVYSFGDDGIPFTWRETNFGPDYLTNPNAAAVADPDGDFFSNLEEYNAGTDPNDTASAPGIRLKIATAPKLKFNAVPGRTYQIERANDVDNPNWQVVAGPLTAASAIVVYVDADAPDNSFYQIVDVTP